MRLLVVGAGLIGSSVALAARDAGWQVQVLDASPGQTELASTVTGLPTADDSMNPDIVVVAVPPNATTQLVIESLNRYPTSTVVDVTSIKSDILIDVETSTDTSGRFVPTHPMAGKETSGAGAATYDLFADRLWVICPSASPADTDRAEQLVRACGAVPVRMSAAEHDATVALTSHLPQLLSSVLAAQLQNLTEDEVAVSGQGLRDMTRIAASAPDLWTEILLANRQNVLARLGDVQTELTRLATALQTADAEVLNSTISAGNRGRAKLPGKHGSKPRPYATVAILINDQPGQLAAIFACAGKGGINVEDVRIDHALGRMVAVIELDVLPDAAKPLSELLTADGWTLRRTAEPD